MPGFEHERMMLGEVAAWAAAHGGLVTYNGRTFDVPLIETRFLFHRLPFPLGELPHLDMLHAARRLWRGRANAAGPDPDDSSCSLAVLEKHLSGLHRIGDVPGYEIPSRYFQFIRDGDARPLESVLEHNRLDLISLAAVMARALTLVAQGPRAATGPHECFGLARLYERAGAHDNAEAAFLRAIDLAQRVGTEPELQADGLRRLAWVRRRSGRIHEAADAWRRLAALPRCSAAFRREAKEALAIYHEHRSRDLGTARSFVLDVLNDGPLGRRREAAEHRLRRLERKIAVRKEGGLVAALDATLLEASSTYVAFFLAPGLAPAFLALVSLTTFAAVLAFSTVCAPNFLVNRVMRPSVSSSFWRPVKNGWHSEQTSRCRSLLVERVIHFAPQAQCASTSVYSG